MSPLHPLIKSLISYISFPEWDKVLPSADTRNLNLITLRYITDLTQVQIFLSGNIFLLFTYSYPFYEDYVSRRCNPHPHVKQWFLLFTKEPHISFCFHSQWLIINEYIYLSHRCERLYFYLEECIKTFCIVEHTQSGECKLKKKKKDGLIICSLPVDL